MRNTGAARSRSPKRAVTMPSRLRDRPFRERGEIGHDRPKWLVTMGRNTQHPDQGSSFSSYDWRDFLDEHNLQQSMSRRGNFHDKAIAESFFQLLKRERIRRKTYSTREEAKQDVFD